MIGDGTLFIRGDEAGDLVERTLHARMLDYWRSVGREGMESYAAGSWGPPRADACSRVNNHVWRQP